MGKFSLFHGVGTALVTPFFPSGELDLSSYRTLLRRQLDAGTDALVVCGTTGESATLAPGERAALLKETVSVASHAVPVIMGIGSNSTRAAVENARTAEALGADALLAVTPYYNKATERGLVTHFREIAVSTSLPIILYTVPSRTGMNIPPSLWGELFAIPNIVGIKDATGDIGYGARFLSSFGSEACLWSGNDNSTLPLLAIGSDGVISVLSNVVPGDCVKLCRLFDEGKTREAAKLWADLQGLCDALFTEVSPVPCKAALSLMGLCSPYCRLPLSQANDTTFARLKVFLENK